MASDHPQRFEGRQDGLDAAQGIVLAFLPMLAVWVLVGLVAVVVL